jgi:hypothetical protein
MSTTTQIENEIDKAMEIPSLMTRLSQNSIEPLSFILASDIDEHERNLLRFSLEQFMRTNLSSVSLEKLSHPLSVLKYLHTHKEKDMEKYCLQMIQQNNQLCDFYGGLGLMYLFGIGGVVPSFEKGLNYLNQSVNNGNYGLPLFYKDIIVSWAVENELDIPDSEPENTIEQLKISAHRFHNSFALISLARYQDAIELYRYYLYHACMNGDVEAMFRLGKSFVENDKKEEGLCLIKTSADRGYSDAIDYMTDILDDVSLYLVKETPSQYVRKLCSIDTTIPMLPMVNCGCYTACHETECVFKSDQERNVFNQYIITALFKIFARE